MFQFRAKSFLTLSGVLLTALLSMSGCLNIFSPFDKPSGDAQLLSAARAAFDNGDFVSAQKYYSQLSNADADVRTEEEAILVFAQNGASMAQFMNFVGNVTDLDAGKAITIFANTMTPTAGLASRLAMWNAWQTYKNISNTDIQFFVEFVGALSIAEEILAEAAGGASTLTQNDIVTTSTSCSTTSCTTNASCGPPTNGQLSEGPADDITMTAPSNAVPTSRNLFDMINAAETALQNLSQGGRFSNIFNTFQTITQGISSTDLDSVAAIDQCFRAELLAQDIGLSQ
jgi:hypothetical protein